LRREQAKSVVCRCIDVFRVKKPGKGKSRPKSSPVFAIVRQAETKYGIMVADYKSQKVSNPPGNHGQARFSYAWREFSKQIYGS
jgi:hypothetical protein